MTRDIAQLCKDAITADLIAKTRAEARIEDDHMADKLYWAAERRKNLLKLTLEQMGINHRDLAEVLQ